MSYDHYYESPKVTMPKMLFFVIVVVVGAMCSVLQSVVLVEGVSTSELEEITKGCRAVEHHEDMIKMCVRRRLPCNRCIEEATVAQIATKCQAQCNNEDQGRKPPPTTTPSSPSLDPSTSPVSAAQKNEEEKYRTVVAMNEKILQTLDELMKKSNQEKQELLSPTNNLLLLVLGGIAMVELFLSLLLLSKMNGVNLCLNLLQQQLQKTK